MNKSFREILPEYPSVRHLPWNPNAKSDKIATKQEFFDAIAGDKKIFVQEKIDGANCGMGFLDGYPVVRTRTKILRKGQELKNNSQKQFASAWNWMHDRKDRFDKLKEAGPYTVYGEWMIQQHGMFYDNLPEWFVAYDLFDYEKCHFVDPGKANSILKNCNFSVIPFELNPAFFFTADLSIPSSHMSSNLFEAFANNPSNFAVNAKREGIVVKISDGEYVTDQFKMVRQGFDQGCLLGETLNRNKLCN